jgi:perosamine synthetase
MTMFVPPKPRFRLYGGAGNYLSVAADLLLRRATRGSAVADLEHRLTQFLGAAHAVGMPQARIGIYLTLKSLIRQGQGVILSPYTIHDVVNMVIAAGGRPVFADIRRDTCNISAREVEALIDERTGAVMVTHLHGMACEIEEIVDVCRRRNVPVIEDAAQAFGGIVAGRRLGTFGRAGIFSFGMAKNVNSFYGGAVITADGELAARLADALRDQPYQDLRMLGPRIGFCFTGDVLTTRAVFDTATFWIYRYGHLHGIDAITNRWRGEDDPVMRATIPEQKVRRLTPMQARLILRAIDGVDGDTAVRIEQAARYHEGLRDLPGVQLPPLRTDGSHIYLTFPIQVADRQDLLTYMVRHGRDLSVQHIGNCADYPAFAAYHRDCPNARLTAQQVLLLPTYPGYGRREIERNVGVIRRYVERRTPLARAV